MSRIGIQPIQIPSEVEVDIEGHKVTVKGPKGELSQRLIGTIEAKVKDSQVIVTRGNDEQEQRALHGLYRALIANDIMGVYTGFEKNLEIVGVGYRANTQGNKLVLNVGYSHPVEMEVPEGMTIAVTDNTKIKITGFDKAKLGQFAADIRKVRKPEPYKGKGIKYVDEIIRRKAGKAAKAAKA